MTSSIPSSEFQKYSKMVTRALFQNEGQIFLTGLDIQKQKTLIELLFAEKHDASSFQALAIEEYLSYIGFDFDGIKTLLSLFDIRLDASMHKFTPYPAVQLEWVMTPRGDDENAMTLGMQILGDSKIRDLTKTATKKRISDSLKPDFFNSPWCKQLIKDMAIQTIHTAMDNDNYRSRLFKVTNNLLGPFVDRLSASHPSLCIELDASAIIDVCDFKNFVNFDVCIKVVEPLESRNHRVKSGKDQKAKDLEAIAKILESRNRGKGGRGSKRPRDDYSHDNSHDDDEIVIV